MIACMNPTSSTLRQILLQGNSWAALKRQCRTSSASACLTLALSGEDTGNSCEVVGNTYIGPGGGVEQRLDGGKAVVAEFEDEYAAGLEMCGGLRDEIG